MDNLIKIYMQSDGCTEDKVLSFINAIELQRGLVGVMPVALGNVSVQKRNLELLTNGLTNALSVFIRNGFLLAPSLDHGRRWLKRIVT